MKFCPQCATELEHPEIEGIVRDRCPSCAFTNWNNPTPVVAAIVELDGDIVLARNVAWPEKMFGLITGFLEQRETPEAAVVREVKEELNLDGEITEFVGHYTFSRMNQIIIAYHLRCTGTIQLNEELAEYKCVPPDKLVPWPMGTGKAVADWLARHHPRD